MAEPAASPARYERKFVTFEIDPAEALAVIRFHPAAFREAYPPRWVNNLYFDTPSLDHYQANVRGVANRVKCRIRWYGDALGPVARPTLELKRKRGLVGSKESHPLRPFELDTGFDARGVLEKSDLPAPLECDLASLCPILMNRYRRRYFLSGDGSYRLTLDSELAYRPIARAGGCFRARAVGDGRVIVELKFGLGGERGASRIANRFPFRLTRSSKYVLGVEALYGGSRG
jgi:hypothetical protein